MAMAVAVAVAMAVAKKAHPSVSATGSTIPSAGPSNVSHSTTSDCMISQGN